MGDVTTYGTSTARAVSINSVTSHGGSGIYVSGNIGATGKVIHVANSNSEMYAIRGDVYVSGSVLNTIEVTGEIDTVKANSID